MSAIACLPCVHIKHIALINNCYPSLKEEKTIPRSSEQSYLLFYATSRPQKLTKVGSYLQKKVARDIRKGRKGHDLVSLHLVKSLIQSCHRDLNLFSKSIIQIFSMLLDTRDLEVIDLVCEDFIVFCSYHDGSTLGVDTEFTLDYEALLKKFAGFCTYTNNDSEFSTKMQYIGHRAIQAAITSSALQASNFKTQLYILFPPLISTLVAHPDTILVVASSSDVQHSALEQPLNPQMIESLAAYTTTLLFNRLTGPSIRFSLTPLFNYFNENAWSSPNFAINMIKLVLNALQPQYRYLLVSDILSHLETEPWTEKHIILVSMLDTILHSHSSLMGISVLEVLNSLFNLVVQHPSLDTLVHAIAGLGSQLYYTNQFNDMIGYLISKLRPHTSLETVDKMPIEEYRALVLTCLDSVVQGYKQCTTGAVPLEAWSSGLGLLDDPHPQTRLGFSKSLYGFLQAVPIHARHDMFLSKLVYTLMDWITLDNFNKSDLISFYALLCLLVRIFRMDAVVLLTPLVFKVQDLIQKNQITNTARQWAIQTGLVDWFGMIAEFYHLESLAAYVHQVQSQRQSEVVLTESSIPDTIQAFDSVSMDTHQVWLDRGTVVEIMSQQEELRDETDTHGLELEAKLFAEWDSDAFLQRNQWKHILPDTNELKPRLASPWEYPNTNEPSSLLPQDKKNNIGVSHLKEALVGQFTEDEETDSSNSNPSLKRTNTEMNAFLNELTLPRNNPMAQSTLSLVNPPY